MKAYLFNAINRYKKFSEELDAQTILCDKSWWVFNDSSEKEVYIFNTDGTLIISVSGRITNATWLYISANKSIVISGNNQSYMVHPVFYDKVVFALQVDGTNDCIFLIDENKINSFKPKNLAELTSYFNRRDEKYIQKKEINKEGIEKEKIKLEEKNEEYLKEEARKIKKKLQEKIDAKIARMSLLFVILFSFFIAKYFFPWVHSFFSEKNMNNIFVQGASIFILGVIMLFMLKKTIDKLNKFLYRRKLKEWKKKHSDDEVSQYLY